MMICKAEIFCTPAAVKLTSRDSRQYQQKACLQFLHIIWAQPSSLSMYTLHLGQRLMGVSSSSALKKELEEKRKSKGIKSN